VRFEQLKKEIHRRNWGGIIEERLFQLTTFSPEELQKVIKKLEKYLVKDKYFSYQIEVVTETIPPCLQEDSCYYNPEETYEYTYYMKGLRKITEEEILSQSKKIIIEMLKDLEVWLFIPGNKIEDLLTEGSVYYGTDRELRVKDGKIWYCDDNNPGLKEISITEFKQLFPKKLVNVKMTIEI